MARRRAEAARCRAAVAAPAPEPMEVMSSALSEEGRVENQNGMRYRPLDALPTRKEVIAAIPEHCFKKDTAKSMMYAAISTGLTIACGLFGYFFIPLKLAFLPAWIAYALVTGTVATGAWVVAHECGHGAFSDNRTLQDAVGYALHSALLVPYFSWQRSHAIHHANTNHLEEGETHVPAVAGNPKGDFGLSLKQKLGEPLWTAFNSVVVLLFGWPAYLIAGASGGPVRGATNHFWPWAGEQGRHSLFPGGWKKKVLFSDVGVLAVLGALAYWAYAAGSVLPVLALYVGPYLVTNAWLVGYTWLQHTDVDIAQYTGSDWNWVRGAFLTVDRPYGPVFDFLHHRIGSTHVAHHVDHSIPHYNALEATEALKKAFPDLYLYDPTPVHEALWRVAAKCIAVKPSGKGGMYVFTDKPEPQAA